MAKKVHWTQTPEGRAKMRLVAKKAIKARKQRDAEYLKELKELEREAAKRNMEVIVDPFGLEPQKFPGIPDEPEVKPTEDDISLEVHSAYLHGKCQQMLETFALLSGTDIVSLTTAVAARLTGALNT